MGSNDTSPQPDYRQLATAYLKGSAWETKDLSRAGDAAYVQTRENFDGFTHQEIYDKAQSIQPELADALNTAWIGISVMLESKFPAHLKKLQAVTDGRWTGATVDASVTAATALSKAGHESGQVAASVAGRIGAVGAAGAAVKLAVPPPASPEATFASMLNPGSPFDAQTQQAIARQQAVDAMNNNYKPTYYPAGDGVAAFSPPPTIPAVNGANGSTSSPTGVGSTHGATGPRAGSGQPPAQQQPGGAPQGQHPGAGNTSGSASGVTGPGAGNAGNSNGPSTQVAAASADPSQSPFGGPGGGMPFGGTSSGDLGGGSGGYGAGGNSPGGFGGGVGPLASPTLGGSPVSGAGSAAAMRPVAGPAAGAPGGMGAPGAGAKKQEDKEHRTPSYLISAVNTTKLLGNGPKVSPPVLGAEYDGNPTNPDGSPKE